MDDQLRERLTTLQVDLANYLRQDDKRSRIAFESFLLTVLDGLAVDSVVIERRVLAMAEEFKRKATAARPKAARRRVKRSKVTADGKA